MTNEDWLVSRGFVLADDGQWVNGSVRAHLDEIGQWWACVGTFVRAGGTAPGAVREAAEAAWASVRPTVDAVNEARAILGR